MPGPVTDPRAHALRDEYHASYNAPDLPVPVESIAEDLLGLYVEEANDLDCSGLLLPAERRVILRAGELAVRQRFTLAHELGHWVCQVKEGHEAPVYCRVSDMAPTADRALEREANVFAAELLMPAPRAREVSDTRMRADPRECAPIRTTRSALGQPRGSHPTRSDPARQDRPGSGRHDRGRPEGRPEEQLVAQCPVSARCCRVSLGWLCRLRRDRR